MSDIPNHVQAQATAPGAKRRLPTWSIALAGLAWCAALPAVANGAYPSSRSR